jgi:SAM-dependent methyltransferase
MLIRKSDFYCIRDKLLDGVLANKLAGLSRGLSHFTRLQAHWDEKATENTFERVRLFSEIPQVRRRICQQYGGKNVVQWIFETFLRGRNGLKVASVGCGTGNAELELAKYGGSETFFSIIGFDPSNVSIQVANDRVAEAGFDGFLNFKFGTIDQPPPALLEESLDVVFAFSSLHHLTNLRRNVGLMRRWLKPGGLLIAHEYIGPTRQQYSHAEVDLINSLFAVLPEKFRRDWHTGRVRRGVPIPGALLMYLYDPSEMVESSDILPAIRNNFQTVNLHVELGTLLLCLLKEIGHNFPDGETDAELIINYLCDIELSLLSSGMLKPHFGTIVAHN